jgi:hypothetical protein
MHKISEISPYFYEMYDATDRASLTALEKCTAALRRLAYGVDTYIIDKCLKLEKTTALKCLKYYCSDIIECFGNKFLCRPTLADTQRLQANIE